jgi:hypothetical protein
MFLCDIIQRQFSYRLVFIRFYSKLIFPTTILKTYVLLWVIFIYYYSLLMYEFVRINFI